jgi:Na+-transporting NADH:ubiquinone oxidoreductase subunit NqrB
MKTNEASWDRILRVVLGLVLLSLIFVVTGPGEASELLRRREVPTPERFKKSTRKRR